MEDEKKCMKKIENPNKLNDKLKYDNAPVTENKKSSI